METRHRPVLLAEVLALLEPGPGRLVVDLTLGGGGTSSAFLSRGASVIAFDRDPAAVEAARARLAEYGSAFAAVHGPFSRFGATLDALGSPRVHGICMDLGMSSDQLDDPQRGFGFRWDGPLDLRFDRGHGEPAWRLVASAGEDEVARWLRELGGVRQSARIARALWARARAGELTTTGQARVAVEACLPRGVPREPELARVFQALRIAVNDELGQLDAALAQVAERLLPGGRFVAIAYHSLEDRRVKRLLSLESGAVKGSRHLPSPQPQAARLRSLTRKALVPSAAEIEGNPRARSARLRAAERLP